MTLTGELYEAIIKVVDDRVREIRVTREMYDRLVEAVANIAEAQKRTEERLGELAEAQKRTEFVISGLGERVTGLEGAVERLEGAVERLAEAQKRTEQGLGELAEAQKRTEESVRDLAKAVGGLSETVGFGVEDVARVVLPGWLERHQRVHVDELERRFLVVDGETVEVNLYGEGTKSGKPIVVLGEAKARIRGSDVSEFLQNLEKAQRTLAGRRLLPVMFGFWLHPSAQVIAREKRILVVASYQR